MTERASFPYNGGSLYYEVDGDGPALTLIHAGVANLRQWDEQVPRFAERYRVIRYDTRGFGRTTTGDVPFSNRGDLAALLDHLGVEQTRGPGHLPRRGHRRRLHARLSPSESRR